MAQREIVGPQERFERSGAQRLRDIRPITTRLWAAMMSEFSGLVLAGGAMAMFVERLWCMDTLTPSHEVIV